MKIVREKEIFRTVLVNILIKIRPFSMKLFAIVNLSLLLKFTVIIG